jgi:3',5'-cyclic AMP phosphodiesterase CpdA
MLTFLSLLLALPPIPAWAEEATRPQRTVRLAVISDVHYVDPGGIPADGTPGKEAFNHAQSAELRIMEKIDPVLVKALDGAVAVNPDALLVSGDLMSNGEYANAERFAGRLREAKGRLGDDTGIYVVNGNHDMNMSYAATFTSEGVEAGRRISQQDWREIFDGLGYNGGQGFSYFADANPGAAAANATVRNSGGLSYATQIAEGVTLIALDTAQYSNDDKALFSKAQRTPGSVNPELLSWAAGEARSAKA